MRVMANRRPTVQIHPPEMLFAQKDQATQTLPFDGANESFSIGVALGNSRRTKDDFDSGSFESLPKVINVLGIAVDNQVRLAQGEAVHGINKLTSNLSHPLR